MAKEEYKVSMRISTVGLVPDCRILCKTIKDAIELHEPALHCTAIRIAQKHEGDP